MAKKSRKNTQADVAPQETPVALDVKLTQPFTMSTGDTSVPKPAVKPKKTVQAAPKKRVRVRKKATKHLSVAVLCTNPLTRRFI